MVIVLVFIAALVLVSGGGYAVVSRVRARKERALKASLNDLMFGDEKPEVRVIGKRKPLLEEQAQPLRVRLTTDFDALIVTWGAYCRALKPYEAAEQKASDASGRIHKLEFPSSDEGAIEHYLSCMVAAHQVIIEMRLEKENCQPLLTQTATEFHKAHNKLVGTLVHLMDLDRQFVIPEDLYQQMIRAEVVANSARRHANQAEQQTKRRGEEEPSSSAPPMPSAEVTARLEAIRKQQIELIVTSNKVKEALQAALESGERVKAVKLEYKEPEKPEAAAVNGFIDAISDWWKLTISEQRAHNAALDVLDQARKAVHAAKGSNMYAKHGDPIEVLASIDTTKLLKQSVDKRLSEDGERCKKLQNRCSVQVEITSPPTGELKNLLAALKSQVRAYAMALGAHAHAIKRHSDLRSSGPKGPDITTSPVADQADVARTMRLLEEWSRSSLKHDETVERAGSEQNKRSQQYDEARKRLTELDGKVPSKENLPEELLVIHGIAEKMLEIQRAKEYRPSYSGW